MSFFDGTKKCLKLMNTGRIVDWFFFGGIRNSLCYSRGERRRVAQKGARFFLAQNKKKAKKKKKKPKKEGGAKIQTEKGTDRAKR